MTVLYAYAGLVLCMATLVEGHIALWNEGMFGYNYPRQATASQNYNSNEIVAPLRGSDNLTQAEWWAHGMLDYPPKSGDYMVLEAGTNYTGELGCNRALTHMRNPTQTDKWNTYACKNDSGPLHTYNKLYKTPDDKWFGGTSLAIAYTSNYTTVKPTDFTVFSVNHTGAFYRETVYQIPKGMPKCPAGGCLCTWNWYHLSGNGEGYGNEFYNVLYKCNITGTTWDNVTIPLGGATVPKYCADKTSNCVSGPKQPIYTWMVSGNNLAVEPTTNTTSPTYNARYGFSNGAQNDIFTASSSSDGGSSDSNDSAASPIALPSSSLMLALAVAVSILSVSSITFIH